MNVEQFCAHLETRLAPLPPGRERLDLVAEALRQAFRVRADEVAIFSLDPQLELLCFLWPEKLQASGLIPLATRDSLAARTVRENRAFVDNRFATTHHTSFFELFRQGPGSAGKPQPIQKILSAPLPGNGWVKGAIQISRKGPDPEAAGADFSKSELQALVEIATVVARNI